MFTEVVQIRLGATRTGLSAGMTAQLTDNVGNAMSNVITTGFVELGAGTYSWTYANFPDGFNGFVKFTVAGVPGTLWSEIEPPSTLGVPAADDLVTLARVRKEPAFASYDDDYLQLKITEASAIIIGETNRLFKLVQRIELYDGDDSNELILRAYPVTVIAAVEYVDQSVDPYILTPYPVNTFYLMEEGRTGILSFDPGPRVYDNYYDYFAFGKQNFRVTYTGGLAAIPADLQMATVAMVKHLISEMTKDSTMQSERLGSYNYTTRPTSAIPDFVRRVISRYKDWRI